MAKKQSRPKMGRPPLPPGERRGASIAFRPTPAIREKLGEASKANARSRSQEVEARLDRSFLEENHLSLICGDSRTARFVMDILDSKKLIESYQEKSVWEDFECHEAMEEALKRLLARGAPRPTGKFKKQVTAYDRYVEKELKPWKERGGGLLSNPVAGDPPTLKPSPAALARAVGRAAADVVTQSRVKALEEVLKAYTPEEE